MTSVIRVAELDRLSVTARMLKFLADDVITDIIHVIKRADIQTWNPISVFTELRISLDIYRAAHHGTTIVDITFSPAGELINFKLLEETISLSIRDVKHLAVLPPI